MTLLSRTDHNGRRLVAHLRKEGKSKSQRLNLKDLFSNLNILSTDRWPTTTGLVK